MEIIEQQEISDDLDQQNWTFSVPETQEEDDTPLFENVSPQPKSEPILQLYFVEQGEWNEFQNNHQTSQLSPRIDVHDESSPTLMVPQDILGIKHESLPSDRNLAVGTSLPSFIRKKLAKEEQEKFANTRLLMFHRDYFFAVMDEEDDDMDHLVTVNKEGSRASSIKRVRSHSSFSNSEEESLDSECDLYVDEAETDDSGEQEECKTENNTKPSSSSDNPILVHFFGDKIREEEFLTTSIYAPCRTKTGAKAIKPNAYVNKRTTVKQTDKTLLLTVSNSNRILTRNDFEVFIIVDNSFHGEELELRDQLNDKVYSVKKLIQDPADEDLLSIVDEKQAGNEWQLSCQVSTSNNFGWKSKHKYYKFLVKSNLRDFQSCVSEEFRVSQNVSTK